MPSVTGIRAQDQVISILEESAWGEEEGTFEADKEQQPYISLADNVYPEEIGDGSMVYDFSENEVGSGCWFPTAGFDISVYPSGSGQTDPAVTTAPAKTRFSKMLSACLGSEPVARTGTTVVDDGVTPTTTLFDEGVTKVHDAGDIVFVEDPSNPLRHYARPVASQEEDTVSTPNHQKLTLGLALPAAPSGGDYIFPSMTIDLSEDAVVALQGDILSRASAMCVKFFGACGSFSIPETAVNAAVQFDFKFRAGYGTRTALGSRVVPTSTRPEEDAGSEMLIAKFGSTVGTQLRLGNWSFDLGREYQNDDNRPHDSGFGGWIPTASKLRLKLKVHHNQAVPAGFTATDWFDLFDAGGTENQFHFMMTVGRRYLGRSVALYLPALKIITLPKRGEKDGLKTIDLEFGVAGGLVTGAKAKMAIC